MDVSPSREDAALRDANEAARTLVARTRLSAYIDEHARSDDTADGSSYARDVTAAERARTAAESVRDDGEDPAGGAYGAGIGHGLGGLGAGAGFGRGHAPGLLAARNPCTGYFPVTARVNQGAVQISVHVDASGHAHAARVLNEMPAGQAFGNAARACAAALHFAPATDGFGTPIAGEAKLELRFSRS